MREKMRPDAGKEGKKEEREQGSKYAYVYRIWDRPRRTRTEGEKEDGTEIGSGHTAVSHFSTPRR